MERDWRIGGGRWRGCHSFTDIICDGNTVEPLTYKRDGGLLEGGRYWYFVSWTASHCGLFADCLVSPR